MQAALLAGEVWRFPGRNSSKLGLPSWQIAAIVKRRAGGKAHACCKGACSVAVSYKPPMLVTRVRLPACALFVFLREVGVEPGSA